MQFLNAWEGTWYHIHWSDFNKAGEMTVYKRDVYERNKADHINWDDVPSHGRPKRAS